MGIFLVTGGAGFIGSHLVDELVRRRRLVRVLDNFSTGKKANIVHHFGKPGFQLIRGDIRDLATCRKACKNVDYVLHQAALGSVPRSVKDPLTSHAVNATGTLNMLIAARDVKVKRFVYASSSAVYGDAAKLPKREGDEGNLLSPYAITKRVDEFYANVFYRLYGLEVIGLRYFNVFGPRQDEKSMYAAVIPLFVSRLMRGEAPTINGDGKHSRDFTYVANVVSANLKALHAPKTACGRAYNIACGSRIDLNRLYSIIAKALGSKIKSIHGPERAGDIRHSHADISLAKKYLKYRPLVKTEIGLRQTVRWYQSR